MKPQNSSKAKRRTQSQVRVKAIVEHVVRPFSLEEVTKWINNLLVAIVGGLVLLVFQYATERWSTAPIRELILKEANLAQDHKESDLADYRDLFAANAVVVDLIHGNTWKGQEEIVNRIRPLRFIVLVHTPTQIVVSKDGTAVARTQTTFTQVEPTQEVGYGNEAWQFVKTKDKAWKIISFQIGFPTP